jgi:hypothetical protein
MKEIEQASRTKNEMIVKSSVGKLKEKNMPNKFFESLKSLKKVVGSGVGSGFISHGSPTLVKSSVSDPDSLIPDPDPACYVEYRSWSRVLMTRNSRRKKHNRKFCYIFFFDQKLQFTHPKTSIKDIQTTREAFSPQNRTSST